MPEMGQVRGMVGGSTMVADGGHLYILQGNRLFKVNQMDLRVVREGSLPIGQPPLDRGTRYGDRLEPNSGGGDQQQR